MAEIDRKAELIASLAAARSQVTSDWRVVRRELDLTTKAKRSFKRHPLPWLGGASILGLIVARLPRRTKKESVPVMKVKHEEPAVEKAGKAGLLLGALKFAFDFAKPALTRWATQRLSEYVANVANRGYTQR